MQFVGSNNENRSSTSTAAAAFAIATSASSNPRDEPPIQEVNDERKDMISSPATIRVLNVLRYIYSIYNTALFFEEKNKFGGCGALFEIELGLLRPKWFMWALD